MYKNFSILVEQTQQIDTWHFTIQPLISHMCFTVICYKKYAKKGKKKRKINNSDRFTIYVKVLLCSAVEIRELHILFLQREV